MHYLSRVSIAKVFKAKNASDSCMRQSVLYFALASLGDVKLSSLCRATQGVQGK
jgi:hypothetical protein